MGFSADRVLCPTDLSPMGDRAVELAYRLASANGTVHLLHINEPAIIPSPLDGTVVQVYYPDSKELAALEAKTRAHLGKLAPTGQAANGVKTEIHAVNDTSVVGCILAAAKRLGADVIVMGTRGRSGFGKLLLGSVATAVMHDATIPVVLAHEPAPAKPKKPAKKK
jgi:nucleotide-binding universal stress UspA family protein